MDPADPLSVFREATWDEALALAGGTLATIRDTRGPNALAGFGSAKGSNEEAYLFQKLVRTGFGTNNVDHCTRLCHASSVAALLEGIGSGAVSNPVMDVLKAEVVLLIGANPVVNHPVAATWIKNAVKNGTQADPRRPAPLGARAPRDALPAVQAGHRRRAAERDDAHDHRGRASSTRRSSPTAPAATRSCKRQRRGVQPRGDGADLRHSGARRSARSRACSPRRRASMILWGMGISQHVHGTDNARCLIALTMMTGQVGRPGTGLHPLRGQNNVQGASDAGLIPMMFPDYQRVDNGGAHDKFEALWGTTLDPKPGLTVVEIMDAVHARRDPRHVHHGREPRDVGSRRRSTRGRRSPSSRCWSCRTSSSPRPRISPT